ncbi:hypothetical protein BGZ57DRAFT_852132 [Hyaloscypha finlandica]|nr:hypothetical protein BGZ57DRAFT_852132 [Hyaloscypha finlandica]
MGTGATALEKLSTAEKIRLVTGIGWGKGQCAGNASPANSINFRTLCLQDGPLGVRSTSAKADGTTITTSTSDTTNQGASAAQNANVAIVFITADSGEEYIFVGKNTGDRNDLDAWHSGADLVKFLLHRQDCLAKKQGAPWYSVVFESSDYGNSIRSRSDNFADGGGFIDYRPFGKASIAPRYEFCFGLYESFSSTVMGGLVWELKGVAYTTVNDTNISITGSPTSGAASGTIVPRGSFSLIRHLRGGCATTHRASFDCAIESCEAAQRFTESKHQGGGGRGYLIQIEEEGFVILRYEREGVDGAEGEYHSQCRASWRDIRLAGAIVVS